MDKYVLKTNIFSAVGRIVGYLPCIWQNSVLSPASYKVPQSTAKIISWVQSKKIPLKIAGYDLEKKKIKRVSK